MLSGRWVHRLYCFTSGTSGLIMCTVILLRSEAPPPLPALLPPPPTRSLSTWRCPPSPSSSVVVAVIAPPAPPRLLLLLPPPPPPPPLILPLLQAERQIHVLSKSDLRVTVTTRSKRSLDLRSINFEDNGHNNTGMSKKKEKKALGSEN